MRELLSLEDMKGRMAACLAYEEQVVGEGVRSTSLRALHYLFAAQTELDRADFKAMLGLGDRLATAQVSALNKRGRWNRTAPTARSAWAYPSTLFAFTSQDFRLWPKSQLTATHSFAKKTPRQGDGQRPPHLRRRVGLAMRCLSWLRGRDWLRLELGCWFAVLAVIGHCRQ
mgnify:CR=1 FL=1